MRLPRRGMNLGGGRRGGGGLGSLLGGRMGIIVIGLLGIAFYWFSNQTFDAWTGKKEFNTISADQARELGAQSYQQILQQELQKGNEVYCSSQSGCSGSNAEITEIVREIGARLEKAAIEYEREFEQTHPGYEGYADQFDWTYYVVESNTPNAFCLPGGYVAVYTQMMDVTGNFNGRFDRGDLDDQTDINMLAAVIGHEIGHALAHHGAKRMSQQKVFQMGQMAVGVGLGGGAESQAIMQAFGMAAQGKILAFSREHETQADEIGLRLMVRACFDPRNAPELWERMGELSGGKAPPEWMSTHPASATRADNFRKWMPAAVEEYERRCLGGRSGNF